MLKTIIRYFMIAGMLFMLAWCFSACGKKGPPLPPGYLEPPVVDDLHYQIIGGRLMLEWSTPESGESRVYNIAGARVYRFKAPVNNEVCRDCPLNLSFVTSIPFESGHMNYREVLEKGYHYAYQVLLYDQADREGKKSNIVDFTYEPQ
jgi:predicted small lipoprotein YifL